MLNKVTRMMPPKQAPFTYKEQGEIDASYDFMRKLLLTYRIR